MLSFLQEENKSLRSIVFDRERHLAGADPIDMNVVFLEPQGTVASLSFCFHFSFLIGFFSF